MRLRYAKKCPTRTITSEGNRDWRAWQKSKRSRAPPKIYLVFKAGVTTRPGKGLHGTGAGVGVGARKPQRRQAARRRASAETHQGWGALMKLESISLKNFQCFGDTTTTIALDEITTLIGPNGAGKSAVLLALCRLFGTSQRGLGRADFHVPPLAPGQPPPKTISLAIDLRLSFPELVPGAQGGAAVPQCFRQMAIDRPGGVPFCRIRLEATWTASNLADGEIEERMCWMRSNDDVPQDDHRTEFKGRDRGLIHVIYIPAARDPSQQIKAASATLLGRLLNVIEWPADLRTDVAQEAENLDGLITATQAIDTHSDEPCAAMADVAYGNVVRNAYAAVHGR